VNAQAITRPGGKWDHLPSLTLRPGGGAVLGFLREGGLGPAESHIATATPAGRWAGRRLATGTPPQVAVGANGTIYAAWGAGGRLRVADNAGGGLREKRSYPGFQSGAALAASGGRVAAGWVTPTGHVKIAERATNGTWSSVQLGSRGAGVVWMASSRGKASVIFGRDGQLWARTQPSPGRDRSADAGERIPDQQVHDAGAAELRLE
jgi:hypothetical protein